LAWRRGAPCRWYPLFRSRRRGGRDRYQADQLDMADNGSLPLMRRWMNVAGWSRTASTGLPAFAAEHRGGLTCALLGCVGVGAMIIMQRFDVLDLPATVHAMRESRNRTIDAIIAVLPWRDTLAIGIRPILRDVVLAPHAVAVAALILLLEWRYPAQRPQPPLSPAPIQDFVWYLVQIGVFSWVIGWFVALLHAFFRRHLAFFAIPGTDSVPVAV